MFFDVHPRHRDAFVVDLLQFACPNEKCDDRGLRGKGNLRLHDTYGSQEWSRLKCTTCGRTFSERRGTPLFRIHITEDKVVQILSLLSRGGSIRSTAEAVGVDKDTVLHVLKVAGEHAREFNEHMLKNLHVDQVQADEIFTFVKKRRAARNAKVKR